MEEQPGPASFAIGVKVGCTDGECGRLTQLVIDPIKEVVTHVIVEPDHRQAEGRLVPVGYVASYGDHLDLSCSLQEFERLPIAERLRFLPGTPGYPGVEPDDMLLWPYFGSNSTEPVVEDSLPVGEVAVQRDQEVNATDGLIGRVDGLIIGGDRHHVTHVLLQEGHLLGRKEVAIPISAVRSVDEAGISLSLSRHQVGQLPPADIRRSGR